MTWDDIYNEAFELSIKIQQFNSKKIRVNALSKEIIDRNNILKNPKNVKNLHNAILENKIQISNIQILLFSKLNGLSLSGDTNEVYQSISNSIEESNINLTRLSMKYFLGEEIINLIQKIEKLSEKEYITDLPFEETEYAKLMILEDEIFKEVLKEIDKQLPCLDIQSLEFIINSKLGIINNYLNDLSKEEQQELLLQYIQLSYDKNSFCYLLKLKTILNAGYADVYDHYHRVIQLELLKKASNIPLEELLNKLEINSVKISKSK